MFMHILPLIMFHVTLFQLFDLEHVAEAILACHIKSNIRNSIVQFTSAEGLNYKDGFT